MTNKNWLDAEDIVQANAKAKKKSEESSGNKAEPEKKGAGDDYWDRVAEDAASGYETNEDEDDILNIDQLPEDNERGDTEGD
jgi:hypothetical protein